MYTAFLWMHCVVSGVFFLIWENHKVFGSIVVFVPIDVVDHLTRAELAPELLLCNYSVFVPPTELGVGALLTRAFILLFTCSGCFPCGCVPTIGCIFRVCGFVPSVHPSAGVGLGTGPAAKRGGAHLRRVTLHNLSAAAANHSDFSHCFVLSSSSGTAPKTNIAMLAARTWWRNILARTG